MKYTNLAGLLALIGIIGGLMLAGMLYAIDGMLVLPGLLIAVISGFIFLKFLLHFLKRGPDIDLDEYKDENEK